MPSTAPCQYVSLDHVSRYLVVAVIAHEDEQLGTRNEAFTVSELSSRIGAYLSGQPDPSGSTLPQQLAKNVFLWPSQNPVRKRIEAALASDMSLTLPPQRVILFPSACPTYGHGAARSRVRSQCAPSHGPYRGCRGSRDAEG